MPFYKIFHRSVANVPYDTPAAVVRNCLIVAKYSSPSGSPKYLKWRHPDIDYTSLHYYFLVLRISVIFLAKCIIVLIAATVDRAIFSAY